MKSTKLIALMIFIVIGSASNGASLTDLIPVFDEHADHMKSLQGNVEKAETSINDLCAMIEGRLEEIDMVAIERPVSQFSTKTTDGTSPEVFKPPKGGNNQHSLTCPHMNGHRYARDAL